jgi:TetR/AcrR family transcriptional repressor of nem operon
MAVRANSSRERILASAEAIMLQKGYASTSIEDILDKASITKSGFFYHFEGKTGLAEALINRYLEQDDKIFEDLFSKAVDLSEDPLHQLLIFLKLLSEMLGNMEETHPGCLVASFTYGNQQFKDNIRDLMRIGLLNWREMIGRQLELIEQQYVMKTDVPHETLSDMFTGTIEGGILLARNFDNNQILVDQIMAYRSFIRLLYGAN